MNNKDIILDIAMNLNRMGNWAADGYKERKNRIIVFLKNNKNYFKKIKSYSFTEPFKKTFDIFLKEYKILEKDGIEGPKDELYWAEKMLTWSNILTHRARLI